MKNFSKIFLFFILLFVGIKSNAQDYDWVNFFNAKLWYEYPPITLSIDADGNQYAVFRFKNTFKASNYTITPKNNLNNKDILLKQDSSGKLLWYKIINDSANYSFQIISTEFDNNGNLLVFISSGNKIIIDSDTIYKRVENTHSLFVVKFDVSGKLLYGKEILQGYVSFFVGSTTEKGYFIIDKNNNLYFTASCLHEIQVFDGKDSIIKFGDTLKKLTVTFKFKNFGESLNWMKKFPPEMGVNSTKIDREGNVYLASYIQGIVDFTFNGLNIKYSSYKQIIGTLFTLDKNGKDKNFFSIPSSEYSTIYSLAVQDSTSIFIAGKFSGDSAKFGSKWEKKLKNGMYNYYGKMDYNGKFKWLKSEDTSLTNYGFQPDNQGLFTSSFLANDSDNFYYLSRLIDGGPAVNCVKMDNQVFYLRKDISFQQKGIVFKIDDRGNILWGFCNDFPFNSMGLDNYSNLYFQGGHYDTVRFGSYMSTYPTTNCYIGKMPNYNINRGEVYPGPYCADDSIKVPYTSFGHYNDTNVFIAELSDEDGEFVGLQRELGRLQTNNKKDTIIGKLPLFDVATSKKYRIRIRSTVPAVQSFYKLDTLRLLIYSKDSADAGLDRYICKGDSADLRTFGGTEWQWTPGNLCRDSSFWRTYAFIDSATEFRVIIRDSSGCGVTDTDYVKIQVREGLEIKTPFFDTAVCPNSSIDFIANTFGGDTLHHYVMWYKKDNKKLTLLDSGVKTFKATCDDVCQIRTKLFDTGYTFIAILWDSCTSKRDTQIYYLSSTKDLSLKLFSDKQKTIEFNDTILCLGQSITLYPKGFGGDSSSYGFEWWVLGNEFLNADTVEISPKINSEYFVVLKDNCSPSNDTFSFKIFLNPALKSEILNKINKVKLPKDTTICFGQKMKFSSKISGGDSSKYSFGWWVLGNELSNSDTFEYTFLKENTTEKIQFILTDNCTTKGDTSEVNVFTKPKIKLTSKPIDTLCLGENFVQKIKVSGGDSLNYSYEWWVMSNEFSNADSAIIPSDSSGTHSIKIIVKDGCTIPNDSLVLDYFVREKLEVSAIISDTFCAGNTINASALAKGGNPGKYSYQWSVNGLQFLNTQNFVYQILSSDEGKLNEIKVKISDNCSQNNDSFIQNIFVTNPLKISLTIDSNCVNNKAKIIANATGGKSSNYQFTFFVDDILKENNTTGIFNFADNKTTKINVKISDNCSANGDSLEINLPAFLPKISATINPTDACEPLEVFLKINNENSTENSYNWSLGNGEIISNILTDTASYIYPKSGTFIGNIKAKTKNNCEVDLVLDKVQVRPLPTVDFTWNPSIITLPNAEVDFQNLSDLKDKFNWQVNDSNFSQEFNTKYIFNDSGFYTIKLIAINEFHCMDSSIKKLFVKDLVSVFIPNAFTPNGDGINDEFTPIVTGIESYEIQIYNRWGQQIFEGNMNNHWNGKYGNTNVPDGIFIYQIRLLRTDKKVIYLNGSLNLLR